MEFLSAGSLDRYLQKAGRLQPQSAQFYSAEIICGLQFLHRRGVIHRDLKPDNVMMDGDGHLKIADFGLVAEDIIGDTTTRGAAGTHTHMAPEELHVDYTCSP
ncbi:protein kinase C delta type-like [Spea bombifrons]|uniref:protein kinase C delta type-like n=1 Tax=Spea bombifrons TaxID=233779 RepID=UPI00234BCDD4|nr:protein kinase C delta type-like [Spea bombifrons]XP_053330382.1 protein kinase C delta type-like [Spea bombifrons]